MSAATPRPQDQPLTGLDWLVLLAGAGGLWALVCLPIPQLKGPAFLGYFAVVWVGLMIVQAVLRLVWRDTFALSFTAAATFLGLAAARYSWGVEHGMSRWTFLAIMAAVGCLLFFLRASDLRGGGGSDGHSSSSGWWSSCNSSSSCGGGGGCGGGCGGGGCGGCGG